MNQIQKVLIARIVPQFFTSNLSATLDYYQEILGFQRQFTYGEPPVYAGAIRDGQSIFFRHVDLPMPQSPDKYAEEYLDAYIRVEGIDALYAEYQARAVSFARKIRSMPWEFREFVVQDCDGRLICFGQATGDV